MNFDARAEGWDTPQRAERAGKLAAEMARRLPAGAFSRVLEFGCTVFCDLEQALGLVEETRVLERNAH